MHLIKLKYDLKCNTVSDALFMGIQMNMSVQGMGCLCIKRNSFVIPQGFFLMWLFGEDNVGIIASERSASKYCLKSMKRCASRKRSVPNERKKTICGLVRDFLQENLNTKGK